MQIDARLEQARIALSRGDRLEVQALLQQLQSDAPNDPQVHQIAVQHWLKSRNTAAAMCHARALLEVPDVKAELLCDVARLVHGADEMVLARALLQRAVDADPGHGEGWLLLAYVDAAGERWISALEGMRHAHRLSPENHGILEKLVDLELDHGMPRQAEAVVRRWAELNPLQVDAQLKLGMILGRLAMHVEGVRHYQDAISRMPESPDLWMALGQSQEYLGRSEDSRVAYQRARALRPDWALPLAGLLGLSRRQQIDAGVWQGARDLLALAPLEDAERAILAYELGKSLDAHGEPAEAMDMWNAANAARQRQIGGFDPLALENLVAGTEATFSRPLAWLGEPQVSAGVVLIVGMPRSGTTLVEQIIHAHPSAHGAGELLDITLMANHLEIGGERWPDVGHLAMPQAQLAELREQYLRSLQARAAPQARLFVDKAPLNFFFIGLAAQLLPDLKVIWCRRDPRDVAVSIYAENFSLDAQFATSWEGIAEYMGAEARLMDLWRKVLPVPIFEMDYQALVDDAPLQARRLMDFLALPWHPACLDFHASGSIVQTPSRWQVRQPVNAKSVGRWQRHAEAMAPFVARARALGVGGV